MSTHIDISSQAGHVIKIENFKANLYDRKGNLIGSFPHRQQAEVYIYTFNHGYQQALGDMGRKLSELSNSSEPAYPPVIDKEEEQVQESVNELRDLAEEMKGWGLTLVHNYASGEWELLEDSTGCFTYDTWWSGEEWIDLKEYFDKFKAENPDRYKPDEVEGPTLPGITTEGARGVIRIANHLA